MEQLPPEYLENLICSNCTKYLTVLPVKVYPDKKVKCGRCIKDNDGGALSELFALLANRFLFPCMNRYEGCKEVLAISDIEEHEKNNCNAQVAICPLCDENCGSAFYLLTHCKNSHPDAEIKKAAFWVDLNQWSVKKLYFYHQADHFVACGYKFCPHEERLLLYFKTFQLNHGQMMHRFKLYFFNSEVPLVTGAIVSTNTSTDDTSAHVINFSDLTSSPRRSILCKFKMWDNSDQNLILVSPFYLQGDSREAKILFTFKGVSAFIEGILYFSEYNYWVGGRLWRLALEKTVDQCQVSWLGLYLHMQDHNGHPYSKISFQIELMSARKGCSVTRNMTKEKFKFLHGWEHFLNWDSLASGGHINGDDNSVELVLKLVVL